MVIDDIRSDDVLIDNLTLLLAAPNINDPSNAGLVDELLAGHFLQSIILHERLILDGLRPTYSSDSPPSFSGHSQIGGAGEYINENSKSQADQITQVLSSLPDGLVERIDIPLTDKKSLLDASQLALPDLGFDWEWYLKPFIDSALFDFSNNFSQRMLVNELSRIVGLLNFNIDGENLQKRNYLGPMRFFRMTGAIKKQAYYLTLSKFLGVPYLPNPFRSVVYRAYITANNDPGFARDIEERWSSTNHELNDGLIEENVIKEFEKYVIAPIDEKLNRIAPWEIFTFFLPPLSRRIYEFSAKKKCNAVEAAIEIRNSENAKAFRRWCKEILEAYEGMNRKELFKLLASLNAECASWMQKLGEKDTSATLSIGLFGLAYEQPMVNAFHEIRVKSWKHILFLREML